MKYNFSSNNYNLVMSADTEGGLHKENIVYFDKPSITKSLDSITMLEFGQISRSIKGYEIGTVNGVSTTGLDDAYTKISTFIAELEMSNTVSLVAAKLSTGGYTGTAKDLENAIIAVVSGQQSESITPSTDLGTFTGPKSWLTLQAGTYTGGLVVNTNSIALIMKSAAGVFSISQTALDLSTYAKKGGLIANGNLDSVNGNDVYNYKSNFVKKNTFEIEVTDDKLEAVKESVNSDLGYNFTITPTSEITLTDTYTVQNNGDKVSFYGKVIPDFSQTAAYQYLIGKKFDWANSFGYINNAGNTGYDLMLRVDGDSVSVRFDALGVDLSVYHLIELVRNSATSYSVWIDGVLKSTKTVAGTGKLIIDNIGNARGGTTDRGTKAVIKYVNFTINNDTTYFKKLNSTTDSRITPLNVTKVINSDLTFKDNTISDAKIINKQNIVLDPVLLNENFNERTLTPTYFPAYSSGGSTFPNCVIQSNIDTPFGSDFVHRLTPNNGSYALPFLQTNVSTIRDSKSTVLSFWKDCYYDDLANNKSIGLFYGYESTAVSISYDLTNGYKKTTTASKTASNGTAYTLSAETLVNNEVIVGTHRWIHVSILIKTVYTGTINLDTRFTLQIFGGTTAFNNSYYYDFYNIIIAKSSYHIASNVVPSASSKGNVFKQLELINSSEVVKDYKIAGAGDSIMYGYTASAIPATDSAYYPQDGVGSFKNYIFQIAKDQKLKWYNYGVSGSTLGNMTVEGINRNGFSVSRYTQMNAGLKTIVLAFGFNDNAYGYKGKIEKWIFDTYGENRYYTTNAGLYNTNSGNGIFYLTAAQNTALEAYASPSSVNTFFSNQYIGAITDSTNTTFYGAYNIVLEYLIQNYPLAKIGIICPYGSKSGFTTACKEVSKKFGLAAPFDFDNNTETPLFYSRQSGDPSANTTIGGVNLTTYRKAIYLSDGTHPNDFGYEFIAKPLGEWLRKL